MKGVDIILKAEVMQKKRFENHSHSHYSNLRLIDSINKPKDLILTAHKLGYNGITLTDHEALCGHVEWVELEKELKESGAIPQDFKCALGNEIYLTDTRNSKEHKIQYYHFILIAKDTVGWKALRELSSQSWLNCYTDRRMRRVPTLYQELEAIVKKYPNSLIATTACLGSELDSYVLRLCEVESRSNNEEEITWLKEQIDNFLSWCLSLFHDDFYIEIASGTSPDQKKFNQRIKAIAAAYSIPIVIGTDAHYLTAEKRDVHRAFLNSKEGEREVDSFYFDAHLMDNEEAYGNIEAFYSLEEFNQMIDNSNAIYNKIGEYDIFHSPIIPRVEVFDYPIREDSRLNDYPIIKSLMKSADVQERYWINQCLEALKQKKLFNDKYLSRIETEADVIKHISDKLNDCLFCYFNTFQHYIDLFWECGSITGPGRGSACGFLSNYLMGITQIDPIRWDLPWFRFLNKERVELPKQNWASKSW